MTISLGVVGASQLISTEGLKLAALKNSSVHRVGLEIRNESFVHRLPVIDRSLCELVKNVVKPWCPFPRSGLRRKRAIVHHKGDAPVRVYRKHGPGAMCQFAADRIDGPIRLEVF